MSVYSLPPTRLILCPRRFVHGDLGRTEPSLASLAGCDADILQLDVTGVEMNFNPKQLPEDGNPQKQEEKTETS